MTASTSAGLGPAEAARLAAVQLTTRFTLDGKGTIVSESPPDLSPGPLLYVAEVEPRVAAVGAPLPEALANDLTGLVSNAAGPDAALNALSTLGPMALSEGLSFLLPSQVASPISAHLVTWGTRDGKALEARFAAQGMPPRLAALGFREVADLWPPWCAAMVDGEVASLAFAARLTQAGAELGLVTLPAHRGQGLAAAATAGWSALPALAGRTLFYSTERSNLASQAVAAKLGLPFICPTWEIARA